MPYKQGKNWRAVITHQGQRHQALFQTKKEAASWEAEKRKELKQNEKQEHLGTDLMTFCSRYLDSATQFAAKTYDEKRSLCRRILELWGADTPAENISPEMVVRYLDEQAKARSANASNKDLKNLRAMWKWGQNILNIQNNPVANPSIKKRRHDRAPQYTPPTEDILRVLKVATREEGVLLSCYLNTAARRSEIFAWTWTDDINFEKREIRLGTRKTVDGAMEYEWLPMNDELYEALWWLWNNRKFKRTPFVFVSAQPGPNYGQPFKVRRRFLKGLCQRAGVKPFGFHALRRYVASVLADEHKVSSKTIQRILRHKNLRTTERYIQKINDDLKSTMDLLCQKKIPQAHTPNAEEG